MIGLAAEECARVDADLDVSASPDSLEVRGVAKLLRRAIRNLLENARRYGSGTVAWAACGLRPAWAMKRQRLSDAATTRLAAIPMVLAR